MNLGGTTIGSIATTRLGFGTSRLHYIDSSAERQRILAAAYEVGIRHFDTAPLYGQGLAERELRRFLKGRTDCVVVTKHGMAATPWIGALPDPVVKPAILVSLLAKKVLRYDGAMSITPAGIRGAVEASLRRIGRDVIDVHLLHEPDPARIPDLAGVIASYHQLIAEGKIRTAGISGNFNTARALLEDAPGFLLQTDECEWSELRTPDITYGAISRQPQSRAQVPVEGETAKARLDAALARRAHGVVLVSTTQERHLLALSGQSPDAA